MHPVLCSSVLWAPNSWYPPSQFLVEIFLIDAFFDGNFFKVSFFTWFTIFVIPKTIRQLKKESILFSTYRAKKSISRPIPPQELEVGQVTCCTF